VAEWIRQHRSPAHVFGYQLHPSTKASALFAEFGAFMGSLGRRSLGEELSRERTLDRELVKRLLAMDLAGLPILIVLDGFEQASKEIAALVKETFAGLTDITPLRLLLTTRRTPAWASEMAGDGGLLQVLTLHGLAPEDSVALLQRRGVAADPSELREFAALTSGHPLLLHLVAQGGATSVSAVQEYFDALWKGLTAEERRVLETASVARRPIPRPALESAARARHGTVESLRTKNLLERTVAGRYMVHDLLRDFLHARVGAIHGRRIHEGLARPLMNAAEARDRWEGVYHLLQAGRVGEAAAYLDAEGAPLMDSVAAEEIASLARSHPADSTDAAMSCVFSELLGDSLRILGHVEPAIYQYTHASRLAEAAGRVERIPRLLRKMASLERWQNRYSKALGYLVEAHARLGTTGNPVERTEVLRELSLVEQALGDLSKAASHLNEAIDLATEGSDWPALSRALLALGSLEAWRGDREAGLAHSQEGLRVATRSGDLTEVAHANIVVGTALGELGRLEESLPFYEKGFELARRLGNLRLTAYALMNRTGALIDLGRCREAGGPLREAQGLIGILGERDTLGLLRIYEGNRERGMGRWTRAKQAWDEGLSALRRFGSPIDLGRALLEVGVFLRDHGEFGEGRAYLLEALGIAQNLGNETLRSEIEGALHGVGRPTIVTDET
jgi:tetratricopeptide (TPR) repeat protein